MKLPPYARPLQDLINKGLSPNNCVYVFVGKDAWNKGKNISISYPERTTIVPPWLSPYHYYWPINNCSVLLVDTGFSNNDYLDEIAVCMYEFGAKSVHLITYDNDFITYHKEVSK